MKEDNYSDMSKLEKEIIMALYDEHYQLIKEKLEARMVLQFPKLSILRTMVLFSTVTNGIKPEWFDSLCQMFILNYGY
jgi:hypothetical protein